jgi:hypothetical protein
MTEMPLQAIWMARIWLAEETLPHKMQRPQSIEIEAD